MSVSRLLTTHAGSLPRPKTLVHLLAAQSGGEEVNPATLAKEVEAATAQVLAKQIESGVDIVNDGEVGRESFFTYVQHRMTGFGGHGQRLLMRDITMYPSFLQFMSRSRICGRSSKARTSARSSSASPIRATSTRSISSRAGGCRKAQS